MKKFLVRLLIVVILCVFGYCFFGRAFQKDNTKTQVTSWDQSQIFDILRVSEEFYKVKMDSMSRENEDLSQHILKTNTSLVAIKKENRNLRQKIENTLSDHYSTLDTADYYANCDSLASVLVSFQKVSDIRDSLYENITDGYRDQLVLKESMISLQKVEGDGLRDSLEKALLSNHQLTCENNANKERIKKSKRGQRILLTCLVAIAGVFTAHAM